jgi:hypothetical protein
MLTIGDVVRVDVQGTFTPDVQITEFRDPQRNQRLVERYIFTSREQGHELGSVELLWTICESFLPGSRPNRLLVIANYGHGKSHFAIIAANYFGQPVDSPAYRAVLDRLRHVIGDSFQMQRFEQFRSERPPYLIVLLRGDESTTYFTGKVIRALEEALDAHEETRLRRPPGWFNLAERFLEEMLPELQVKAELFLGERYELDLAALKQMVRERDIKALDLCRELSRHLVHVPLDFGEASLREAVEWVADEFTGQGKPFGGVLILFDEFSTFVDSYARGSTSGEAAPLQDLLSGVERRRGKVTFVAFAQLDPRNILEESSTLQTKASGVLKELDRLDEAITLRSVLEEVVDAYLAQDETAWRKLEEELVFRREIQNAMSVTLGLFKRRYEEELRWNRDDFRDTVVKGCFPLHPLTTALFATLKFGRTSQPRSVLRFVFDQVKAKEKEPALRDDGRVNWVRPIVLVDEFAGMFPEPTWTMYQQARDRLGSEADPLLLMVLKAVLLILVGELPTKSVPSQTLIAHLCGQDESRVQSALEELTRRHILRYDRADDRYFFWITLPYQCEQILNDKINKLSLSMSVLQNIVDYLQKHGYLEPVRVNVSWGSPGDWLADYALITAREFSEETLRKLAQRIIADPGRIGASRGLVIWALATTAEEVDHYRQNGQAVLTRALEMVGYPQLPVVLMRPQQPNPDLPESLKRLAALLDFNDSEKQECGREQYEDMLKHQLEQVGKLLDQHRSRGVAVIPTALSITRLPNSPSPLATLLLEVFKAAFRKRPQEFFTQYPQYSKGPSPFRRAVTDLAHALALDNLLQLYPGMKTSNAVAAELFDRYLGPSGKWKLVGQLYRIQSPPPESPLWPAWRVLEEKIPVGAKGVRLSPILETLLNPPYGYDAATLLLLLSAWYGYNRQFLELSVNGRLHELHELIETSGKGSPAKRPQDVLAGLISATVSRRDPGELVRKAQAIVERVERRERVSPDTAKQDIQVLEQALDTLDPNTEQRQRFSVTKIRLEKDLNTAKEYTERITIIREHMKRETDPGKLLDLVDQLARLDEPNGVVEAEPKSRLQEEARDKLQKAVETTCQRLERLTHHGDYQQQEAKLADLQEELERRDLRGLAQRVNEARVRLAEDRERLEREEKDRVLVQQLSAMIINEQTGLATLRRYADELARLQAATERGEREIATKRQRVQEAIARLGQQLSQLESRLRTLRDSREARQVRDHILRQRYLYEETPEVATIDQLEQRATELQSWLEDLERLRERDFHSPVEATAIQQELDRLADVHPWLSEAHREVLTRARQVVQERIVRKRQAAQSWLDDLERRIAAKENPHQLAKALEQEQPFLPDSEKERLARLRQEVAEMLEADAEGQVIRYFKQIRDRKRQWELLQRLMDLVSGTEEP